MKKKNLLLYVALGFIFISLLKSCGSSNNKPTEISANEQLLERIGLLEEENKKLKEDYEKIKTDYEKIKTDYDNMKLVKDSETKPIEKPPVESTTEETTNEPLPQPTNDREPGNKLSEKDRKELAIVFAQDYVEDMTGIKMSVAKGDFNVSIQNYSPKHDAYIVTYNDSNNARIKYIFDWDGTESDGYYENDPWYLLVNGVEYYNELDVKRENAINDK